MAEEVQKSEIAQREEEILKFWQDNNIFQKSLSKDSPKGEFVFYDGPPFATGLPHYGHILASAIKDAVPRYRTMQGYRVPRRWGWDTHGLPIENIVEKDLKISGRKQIEEYGVEKFNEYARSKVFGFMHEWKRTVDRMARWVDFDGSYKTMDNSYIESVWWALKEIHDKGLIYESTRVLPYCPRCETPIANSEIAMDNSYRDITDISVYVKFKLVDEPNVSILAWTTTPWTLPGNFALAVNAEVQYVKVKVGDDVLIVAKDRLAILKDAPYEIVGEIKGTELVGKKYIPPFTYFAEAALQHKENAWKIWAADFVTTTDGTGVVHVAPGYGEDDLNLAKAQNIPFIHHVTGEGKFTSSVKDFAGVLVKPKDDHQATDILIIKHLAHAGLLFAKEKIVHSYPFCYRCDTPLFYYAIPAWFIKIKEVKQELLERNNDIHWIPGHLKHGRFEKSMEGAPDWNISRNRFWASPLPMWKCVECNSLEIIGSLQDLKNKVRRNTYHIVRHAEAESNVQNITSGVFDVPHHVTEKGKKQAEAAAKDLKSKKIDLIISSDFVRAKETTEILAQSLGLSADKIVYDKRIREYNFGDMNGQDCGVWHTYWQERDWNDVTTPVPGGESPEDVHNRIGAFLYDIDAQYEGKNILIVSHQDAISYMQLVTRGASLANTTRVDWDKLTKNFAEPFELEFANLPHNRNFELDMHRPYIDQLTWKCKCGGLVKRIPEVIDCWFESGAMPYAAEHFPFENQDWLKTHFPAQFVAEYISQTRTWFYYMHVVSVILQGKAPFEHVVTTGTVLAEDGQKMSKSKGNFPDPWLLFNKFGVDALRYYLLASPLLKAEDLNFSERDVENVYKKLILRLNNVMSFYLLYAENEQEIATSDHPLDVWIMSRLAEVVRDVTSGMEKYELDQALRPFDLFVDDLSTWYVRRSRERFKGEDEADRRGALSTLRTVLLETAKVAAPFMPYLAEDIYKKLGGGNESVHLESWPQAQKIDSDVLKDMAEVRKIVSLGLELRSQAKIKTRQPLKKFISGRNFEDAFIAIVKDELNVKEYEYDASYVSGDAEKVWIDTEISPELKLEGQAREFIRAIQDLRKKANLNITDTVELVVKTDEAGKTLIEAFKQDLMKTAQLSAVLYEETEGEPITVDEFSFVARLVP